ncbi:MAG: hypothetical protein HY001_01290 [Candidatus Portnoybacteria bacterium]|nr:hypothetical protein [Candidatus Portnoybacteria bacterium]
MRSFTLAEILLVVVFIALMVSATLIVFSSLGTRASLESSADHIISTLKKAQYNTISSKDLSGYGVHFEQNQYVLFKGLTYTAGALENETYPLPPGITLASIALAGGNDVVFLRIDGRTANTGSLVLQIGSNPSPSRVIVVEASGNATLDQGIILNDTRISDSRHLHFSLGWSIQNASTLTLVFGDILSPEHTEVISMAPFFNAQKTESNWSGTINVAGENQVLAIRTHQLDALDTLLSIHRDRRFNTKALQINIDAKPIVSYTAPGTPTVGLFGGTMTIQ